MTESFQYREELERVLESDLFREAEALRRMLAFLGDAFLRGGADQIKEYTVGVEALRRPATYDTRSDPTVRVQASKLRQKLHEYYQTVGSGDPIEIGMPKGHYRLTFAPHNGVDAVPKRSPSRRSRWLGAGGWVAAAVVAVIAVLGKAPSPPNPLTPELQAIWAPLLGRESPVMISYETGMVVTVGRLTVRAGDVNAPDEIPNSKALENLIRDSGSDRIRFNYNYVGYGIVNGAYLLSGMFSGRKLHVFLKRGSDLRSEDFRNSDLIFLGNGKGQPLIRDLLSGQDFVLSHGDVHNQHPAKGEELEYHHHSEPPDESSQSYGLITMMPGPGPQRRILALEADSATMQLGVVEYVTDAQYARELVSKLRGASQTLPQFYQVLVMSRFKSGVPVELRYVTHHVHGAAGTGR